MTKRIDDAGAVIAGARKFGSARHLTLDDLAAMTAEEAATLVTKDHIWPKPDYQALVDAGMDREAAALVKIIRDRMAAKPRFNIYQLGTRQLRDPQKIARDFVRMTEAVRDVLTDTTRIQTARDVAQSRRAIYERVGWTSGETDPEIQHLIFSINKGRRSPLYDSYADPAKARDMLAEGFPGTVPGWRKGVLVRKLRSGEYYLRKGSKTLQRGFSSEEEALAWLEENNQPKKSGTRRGSGEERKKIERPHLERVERSGGPDYRCGRDIVDGEEFIETFGFRGVQFGEWLPNEERQSVLNHAYDALMDLCSVLKVDPGDLSLGGELALAFGSRGRGKAAAHYEPGQRVLNLTRMNGAGALAHEFAHAFDHWAGNPDWSERPPAHPGGIPSGSGWQLLYLQRAEYLTNLSASQAQSWHRLMRELYREPTTGKFKDSPNTSYAKEAVRINGATRGYWLHPTEMFARAFEAYVFDALAAKGVSSPYLVHGVEEDRFTRDKGFKGNPYPEGKERRLFNANIENVIEEMRPSLERLRKHDVKNSIGFSL